MMVRRKGYRASVVLGLGIALILAGGAATGVALTNRAMRDQVIADARSKAELLADHTLAVHAYFAHRLLEPSPNSSPATPPGAPRSEWAPSSQAVEGVGRFFHQLADEDFYYVEWTTGAPPVPPQADERDRAFLDALADASIPADGIGFVTVGGEEYLVVQRRGEAAERSCWSCHVDPDHLPPDTEQLPTAVDSPVRATPPYVSALSIGVPISKALANANSAAQRLALQLAAVSLIAVCVLLWLVKTLIATPLNRVKAKALEVADGASHLGETIPEPRGREFRELVAAFNQLSVSLKKGQSDLENQVQERTRGLQQANADLAQEIAERARADEALRESESQYRQLFRAMSSGFALHEMIFDSRGVPCDYRFIEVNPAFERLTGLKAETLIGRTVREVMPGVEPLWIERYGRVATTGESIHFENYSAVLDKYYEVVAYSPERGRFAAIFSDITERKRADEERFRLERQIQQTQKLESLGVLAGGIAHDFNNILMAVLGHASMALEDLSPVSPACESIKEIEQAARRAAELCRQMLAYSGKGKFVIEPIHLPDLVEEMVHLLRTLISKKAILNLNLEKKLPPMRGDATQIRQVIMNLVVNASEAIGERSGVITISTGAMDCPREYLAETCLDENLDEGLYVYVEVSDTGCGMDKETMGRLFEPFFTTKFTGRGLGMSAVLGIVRGHRGGLKVYSETGKGTTFKILFPALETEAVAPSAKESQQHIEWQGVGRVLLVDDEETIRALGKKMLEHMGFAVLTAEDGRQAVDIYREQGGEIDLVLLDLTMPHMNGEETFRELRRINSSVRVVLSSGYTEHEVATRFAGKGLAGFIQKPYNMTVLRERLRLLCSLDGKHRPT